MGFLILTGALVAGSNSGKPSAQPSRPKIEPPSLTCGGCGAPLSAPGGACDYCQRGVRYRALRSTFVAEVPADTRLCAVGDRVLAVSPDTPPAWVTPDGLETLTIGVDPGSPDGDQTAYWPPIDFSCEPGSAP